MLSLSTFWAFCAPLLAPAQALPAERRSGTELLESKLRLASEARQSRHEVANQLLRELTADEPTQHWARHLLALEASRLGLRPLDSLKPWNAPPDDEMKLEAWATSRLPFVEPTDLLRCAHLARSRGRFDDAVAWFHRATVLTPISEHAYWVALQGLLRTAGRADALSPRARPWLHEVFGRTWFRLDDVARLSERLAALDRDRDDDSMRRTVEAIVAEGCGTRIALALRLRWSTAHPSPEGWRPEWLEVAERSPRALDRSGILRRVASAELLRPDDAAAGLARLESAASEAPPSLLRAHLAGDLLTQWARDAERVESVRGLVDTLAAGPDAMWSANLDALDAALELTGVHAGLGEARALALRCLDRVGDHPFRARLLTILARSEPQPERAAELYRASLRVEPLGVVATDCPQLEALEALAMLYEERGDTLRAAETLARALALSPLPEAYQAWSFAPYGAWARLALQARVRPEHVARLIVSLLDDGRAVGRSQWTAVCAILFPPFEAHRDVLQRALRTRHDACRSSGITPESEAFFDVAHAWAACGGALLDELRTRVHEPSRVDDATLYDVVEVALDAGEPRVALAVLRVGLRKPTNGSLRFETPPPIRLRDMLLATTASARTLEEAEPGLRLFERQPGPRARAVTLQMATQVDHPARHLVVRSLEAQLTSAACAETPWTADERAALDALFERLEHGCPDLVPSLVRIAPDRALRALEAFCHDTHERRHQWVAVRRVADVDVELAGTLLASLARGPSEESRLAAQEALRRSVGRLPAHARRGALDAGVRDSLDEVRRLVATTLGRVAETPGEVRWLLELWQDAVPDVAQAATRGLEGLHEERDLPTVADYVLEHPDLLDRPDVHRLVTRLGGPDLGNPAGTSRAERIQKLRTILRDR